MTPSFLTGLPVSPAALVIGAAVMVLALVGPGARAEQVDGPARFPSDGSSLAESPLGPVGHDRPDHRAGDPR